jgi:thymidylate synthase
MKDKSFIRAFNKRGTYFQRLIWWPSWDSTKGINQLENVIQKINSGKSSRVVHELNLDDPPSVTVNGMHLYNPESDKNFMKVMSFPCLSYISIKPDSIGKSGGKVHMTALYRNHHFISRAYGNYLGLGWLLKFIADATGKKVGELLCVSSLAQMDFYSSGVSKTKTKELLRTLNKGGA